MRPLNASTSPQGEPSGSITWTGEAIPCLGICYGMSLNKLMYIVASKVCELTDPYDLSELTLQCALDVFNTSEPASRTIGNILQLALDNGCGLKDLTDSLQNQIDGLSQDNFIVNLKCLAERDSLGNTLAYTRDSVMQLFVNEICELVDDYTGLAGKVTDLQNQFDNYINVPKVIEEVSVTTCLATNKPVSQQVVLGFSDYCNYKAIAGQPTQIQSAIALQPADFNTIFASNPAWVTMPTSMAVSLANLWVVIANHESRIQANEKCCQSTCEDVKIGYEVLLSEDGKFISLKFSTAAGTYIPSGFEDKGSSVILTDYKGQILSYSIEVIQDGTTDEFSLTGLDTSQPILIDMTALIGDNGTNCTKCVPSKSFSVSNACPVCLVTVTGDKFSSGSVTITYKV